MKNHLQDINFWKRIESFVSNVKVNDQASEEEKQMILHICNKYSSPKKESEETQACESCGEKTPMEELEYDSGSECSFCPKCYSEGIISMYRDFCKLYPEEYQNYRNAMEQGALIDDLLEQKKQIQQEVNGEQLSHGDKVMCSNDPDFEDFWYGKYIGKHPRLDLYVVLTRARPELKIHEELDSFAFVKKRDFPQLTSDEQKGIEK